MLHIGSHKERVAKVKKNVNKNKMFSIIAVIIVFFLLGNLIFNKNDSKNANKTSTSKYEDTDSTEKNDAEPEHWRFYWTDLWVLVIGGGFCGIMIIKERKKAKDKLK